MDTWEKIGYACLGSIALLYLAALIFGMIAVFPYGLLGLVVLLGIGLLFIKVLIERLRSAEDDHYSRNVDK